MKHNCPSSPNVFCKELFRKSALIAAQHRYTQSLLRTRPYSVIPLQLFRPTLLRIDLHSEATYITQEYLFCLEKEEGMGDIG